MRLSHRLSLLIGLLLLAALGINLLASVENSRSYLNRQLASHAQDTATSLGLSLSTALAEGDRASAIGMTNAIFDRGDYVNVRIEGPSGELLFERVNPVVVDTVPAWFVSRLPLEPPERDAKVMNGWRQSGRVVVRSHPGYAYLQLWENSLKTGGWLALAGLLTLFLGLLALRRLLTPLMRIEDQADAICRREFPEVSPLPKAPEFARIVIAMNRMTRKVKTIIGDLESLARKLQALAYRHPVTGLANKRHFLDVLTDLVTREDQSGRGSLILIRLHDFKRYNETRGYQAGDELLKGVAGQLAGIADGHPEILAAHLSGADFALLVDGMGHTACETLLSGVAGALGDLRYLGLVDSSDIAHLGALVFEGCSDTAQLLAAADHALRQAESKGPNASHVELKSKNSTDAKGAAQHRREVREAIEQNRLSCQLQPVIGSSDKRQLHREVLARLTIADGTSDEQLLTAGQFVPTAMALGLGSHIDRAIIQRATDLLALPEHQALHLAVNFTPNSLDNRDFVDWLLEHLDRHPDAARRLLLEMPEFGLTGRMTAVQSLIEELHLRGTRFGLDRYGRTEQSITNLKALKLDHIKIDGAFAQSLEEKEEYQFFIQALADIAHGLDIQVVVEAVESETVWDLLPDLKVDGAQGYFVGRPA